MVGLEQIIVRADILARYRFPSRSTSADGQLIEKIVRENPGQVIYRPDLEVYFNALEPGRWDVIPQ